LKHTVQSGISNRLLEESGVPGLIVVLMASAVHGFLRARLDVALVADPGFGG